MKISIGKDKQFSVLRRIKWLRREQEKLEKEIQALKSLPKVCPRKRIYQRKEKRKQLEQRLK